MPRAHTPRPKKHWSVSALEDAIAERKSIGTSFRDLQGKYNIPKSTLERHINSAIGNQGRKPVSLFFCFEMTLWIVQKF